MKGFKNAKVCLRGKGVVTCDIAVNNERIASIGSGLDIEPVETEGLTVVAGFIDEHIHGAYGVDAMDGENLSVISQGLLKEGTTAFLATTMTQSADSTERALKAVSKYCAKDGAELLGVHLEGPFISPRFKGAQNPEFILKPDKNYFEKLQSVSGGKIKLVTLAPEESGGKELVRYLKNTFVTASVGHSNAKQSEIEECIKAGLSCVTHTFNAQSPVHHRDIGVAGSALLYGELACEVIADCIHVSVPALKLLIKNKPKDKIILITDAMRAKGLCDGEYDLGGQNVFVKGGKAQLSDGTLAGSVLKMNEAVKNIVQKCGVPLCDAVDFASYNPAKNLGVEKDYGSVEEGKFANFALLDNNFNVKKVMVKGKLYSF